MGPSRGTFVTGALVAAALAIVAVPTPTMAEARGGERTHVVSPGNTLGSIARRYHVTIAALREANGLGPGQPIRLGQRLVIPAPEPSDESTERAPRGRRDRDDEIEGGTARARRARHEAQARSSRERDEADDAPPRASGFERAPRHAGSVRLVHGDDGVTIKLFARNKHLAPRALDGFSRMLRFYPTGARHPIDPRLVTLVGIVSDHFGGRDIHVVSGFRPYSPKQYTPHSNHNLGRAMDFNIPGVPNEVVRDFCRTLRNVGVGYYPNSSFVHMDVRTEKAFWVDEAGPGEPPRYRHKDGKVRADEGAGEVDVAGAAAGGGAADPDGSEGETGSDPTHDGASENPYLDKGNRPSTDPKHADSADEGQR